MKASRFDSGRAPLINVSWIRRAISGSQDAPLARPLENAASGPVRGLIGAPRSGCAFVAAEVADERVERWREEQPEAGDTQHAEQHCCPQGLAHLRAGASGHGQRSDTQDERKGSHQYRAQTCARGMHGSLTWCRAVFLLLPREFHDENRVLG